MLATNELELCDASWMAKAKVRARTGHPLRVIECQFAYCTAYPQRKPWKRYRGLSKVSFPSSDKAPDRRETRDLALFDLVIDSKLRACSKCVTCSY